MATMAMAIGVSVLGSSVANVALPTIAASVATAVDDDLSRIGALADSSLVARRIAPIRRAICASPRYLAEHGAPRSPADLARHQCIFNSNDFITQHAPGHQRLHQKPEQRTSA